MTGDRSRSPSIVGVENSGAKYPPGLDISSDAGLNADALRDGPLPLHTLAHFTDGADLGTPSSADAPSAPNPITHLGHADDLAPELHAKPSIQAHTPADDLSTGSGSTQQSPFAAIATDDATSSSDQFLHPTAALRASANAEYDFNSLQAAGDHTAGFGTADHGAAFAGHGSADGTAPTTGHAGTDLGNIHIDAHVNPITVVSQSYQLSENNALVVNAANGVLVGDSDTDNSPLSAELITNATDGALTLNADGSFTYVPNVNFYGTDTFEYAATADGGTEVSNPTYVTLNVNEAPPTVVSDTVDNTDINASGEVTYTVTFSEPVSGLTALEVYENVARTGSASVGTINISQNSGDTYSIEFSDVSGTGTLQLVLPAGDVENQQNYGTTSDYDSPNIITIDNTAPTASSLGATATSTAKFATAHTVTFTMDMSVNVTVANGTTLALSDGGTATYVSGSGTSALIFTYSATDAPQALTVASISSGSIVDGLGNAASLTGTVVAPYSDAVSDTAANVELNFASLASAAAYISSITLTDSGTPHLALSASDIVNDQTLLGKIDSTYKLFAYDSAVDIAANIDSLETYASEITAVVFTDTGTPTLDLTETQLANDHAIVNRIRDGAYDLSISGVTDQSYTSYVSDYNASEKLTLKTEQNTNGSETVIASGSGQTLSGTTSHDIFDLQNASDVTVTGGTGNDTFIFGGNFSANDTITGGSGHNVLTLNGEYAYGSVLDFNATTISNINAIQLHAGNDYNLTLNGSNLTAGHTLTIDASSVGGSNYVYIDASQIAAGKVIMEGGSGSNYFRGGSGDLIDAGSGSNSFEYSAVGQTTGTGFDTINGFNAAMDHIEFDGFGHFVQAIDPTVTGGNLSNTNFDASLTAHLGASELGADSAVLYTPTGGEYAGDTFLIVNSAGTAGYAAGQDFVFLLTHVVDLSELSTGTFGGTPVF